MSLDHPRITFFYLKSIELFQSAVSVNVLAPKAFGNELLQLLLVGATDSLIYKRMTQGCLIHRIVIFLIIFSLVLSQFACISACCNKFGCTRAVEVPV